MACRHGISKAFAATGVRVGWAVGPVDVIDRMSSILGHVGAWAPRAEQVATAKLLEDGGAIRSYVSTLREGIVSRLTALHEGFQAMKSAGLPVVACLCFDSGAGLDRTLMGTTPEQGAQELTAAEADVIGSNCGQGIAGYVAICRRLRAATDRPIWVKPNAGIPDLVNDVPVWKTQEPRTIGRGS